MTAPPLSDRPLIGVTKPSRADNLAYACIWAGVWLAGGRPVRLTASKPRRKCALRGLVLGGGTDVFPGLYDAKPRAGYAYDRKRDEMEIEWAERAERANIPVLAICRGAQMMNVMRGGTLFADVAKSFKDVDYPSTFLGHVFYRKTILIEDQTLLHDVLGDEDRVNSMHKQAIADLGNGLEATARERNGVIQCIEDRERNFYMGVQFHPEFLLHRSRFRGIFNALVTAAAHNPTEVTEDS
ncbi:MULTISPECIES: gamma-glutamyl-gamma-aminobutyrate hydrolase family protein [Euryhalocaulis]|uniref:gamma-glutamyl-gamma-aminobutyrate hydrolase family protein n=1 Tax=Euryhalocaulis TaxID=1712422 RepID=UPI0003A6EED4|nr:MULTISPECIES: type 1 glutamine amidotransferase [Euryhalocaulis]MBA4800308.1 type 1 glutamine amidotransferase [Euryhalocaulis sp.]